MPMCLYGGWGVGSRGVIFIFFGVYSVHHLIGGRGLTILPRDINSSLWCRRLSLLPCSLPVLFFCVLLFPSCRQAEYTPGRIRTRSFSVKAHLFIYFAVFVSFPNDTVHTISPYHRVPSPSHFHRKYHPFDPRPIVTKLYCTRTNSDPCLSFAWCACLGSNCSKNSIDTEHAQRFSNFVATTIGRRRQLLILCIRLHIPI